MNPPLASSPPWLATLRRRGGFVLVSVALHVAAVALWAPRATPPADRALPSRSIALSVRLGPAAAPIAPSAAPSAAPVRTSAAVRPAPPRRAPATSTPAAPPVTAEPALPTTEEAPPVPEHAAPAAPVAVTGIALAGSPFASFGTGGGRRWGALPAPASAEPPPAALAQAAALQAQQWRASQAQQFQLQQVWAAMQAQVSQWPAPAEPLAQPCPLAREAQDVPECDGIVAPTALAALLATAHAYYRLAPARQMLVLAYAAPGYRIELAP